MLSAIVLAGGAVAVSASMISLLAVFGARRRSPALFVGLALFCWVVIGCGLGYYSRTSSLLPDRIPVWRDILASLIVIAPFALVPAAFTLPAVFGAAPARRILALALAGAIIAVPFALLAVVPTACYVAHDCP